MKLTDGRNKHSGAAGSLEDSTGRSARKTVYTQRHQVSKSTRNEARWATKRKGLLKGLGKKLCRVLQTIGMLVTNERYWLKRRIKKSDHWEGLE